MHRDVIDYIEPYDPGLFPGDVHRLFGLDPEHVVNLASNESPYPPAPAVQQAIFEEIPRINRYPHPDYVHLRTAIGKHIGFPKENIAVAGGCTEIIDIVCKVFVEPFDRIIIPVPSYSLYILMSMLREAQIFFASTEDREYSVRSGDLISGGERSKITFLCSPNNPTGRAIERHELIEIVENSDGIVFLDEAYAEFSGCSALDILDQHPNLIIARSMSKSFGLAGLRVGYAVGHESLISKMRKSRNPFSVSKLSASAAISALSCSPYYSMIWERIRKNRLEVFSEVSRMEGLFPLPSEANFLMIRVDPRIPNLVNELANRGVLVRDLQGVQGLEGQFIRVTIGTPDQNGILLEALNEALG